MKKEYYCKQLNTHKFDICKVQHETDNLNSPITNETELVILKLRKKKSPGLGSVTGEFYQTFKEELTPVLYLFQKTEEEEILSNSFDTKVSQRLYQKR